MFTKNPIDCPYIIFRAANLQLDVLDIMKMKIVDSNKEKFWLFDRDPCPGSSTFD